ncbi:MAG: bifunctional enzyme CysN/CysC [Oleiphilaceae bacterium]|jgi:bifunctional enzyme CysN/CysC
MKTFDNIFLQKTTRSRSDRRKLNGHKGLVIWITGLSGAGKSTLANALEIKLYEQNKHTYILDGDNIRLGLNKDLGFSDDERKENIRRTAETAKLMLDAGLVVITATISPFRSERLMAKEIIGVDNFIEIFINTSLAVCEKRDPKGLYKKARLGLLPNMTGIQSPYEEPINADFIIDGTEPISDKILDFILNQITNKKGF